MMEVAFLVVDGIGVLAAFCIAWVAHKGLSALNAHRKLTIHDHACEARKRLKALTRMLRSARNRTLFQSGTLSELRRCFSHELDDEVIKGLVLENAKGDQMTYSRNAKVVSAAAQKLTEIELELEVFEDKRVSGVTKAFGDLSVVISYYVTLAGILNHFVGRYTLTDWEDPTYTIAGTDVAWTQILSDWSSSGMDTNEYSKLVQRHVARLDESLKLLMN